MYGPKINRVCLPFTPFPASKHSRLINKTATALGWGLTEPEKNRSPNYIQRLQQGLCLDFHSDSFHSTIAVNLGNLTLFDDSHCQRDHGNLFHSETEFCAGDYQNETDTKVSVYPSAETLFSSF